MKRLAILLLIAAFALGACACSAADIASALGSGQSATEPPPADETAPESPAQAASPTDLAPGETGQTAPEATSASTPAPTPADVDWQGLYTAFLSENYDELSALCFGGIAGVGFIDLDLDGVAELALFDSGASASMGVQFFDIVDGEIQCVSANMAELGTAYGGSYYTDVFVNANLFDDFRLMQDSDGRRFFMVNSWNGALDFAYSEIITFGQAAQGASGAALALASVLYRYDDYDTDTGAVRDSRFEAGGVPITEEEYNTVSGRIASGWTDTGFVATGCFIWESRDYTGDYEGLMAMAEAAVAAYKPALDYQG